MANNHTSDSMSSETGKVPVQESLRPEGPLAAGPKGSPGTPCSDDSTDNAIPRQASGPAGGIGNPVVPKRNKPMKPPLPRAAGPRGRGFILVHDMELKIGIQPLKKEQPAPSGDKTD